MRKNRKALTEPLNSVVDADLKRAVTTVAEQEDRSEGAIVRAALRVYPPVAALLKGAKP